jgi:hypothetical protein
VALCVLMALQCFVSWDCLTHSTSPVELVTSTWFMCEVHSNNHASAVNLIGCTVNEIVMVGGLAGVGWHGMDVCDYGVHGVCSAGLHLSMQHTHQDCFAINSGKGRICRTISICCTTLPRTGASFPAHLASQDYNVVTHQTVTRHDISGAPNIMQACWHHVVVVTYCVHKLLQSKQ